MFGLDAAAILAFTKNFAENMIKNLNPIVMSLLSSFLIIDLTLSFLFDESDGMNIFIKLIKKILYYGFFIWIIQEYANIVFHSLMGGAIQLANVASGKGAATSVSLDLIAKFGVDTGDLIGSLFLGATGLVIDFAGVESGTTIVLLGVLGYLVFFLMLYVQILTAFVKFYLVTGYAFILIPFGVFEKTKDIALKGLNGLFGQAIELFVLVVLLNLTEMFMDGPFNSTVGMKIDGYAAIKSSLFTKVGVLMFLFLMINKAGTIASALLSGAIASIGIGAEAGARGLNNAISAPGRLAGGLADKASDGKRDGVGGGKMFRDGSSAQNAYQNAASFIKGKFRKGGQSGGNSNNSSSSS
jgi:trbL/virB6 plasmid conjugal transfer protein